MTPPPPAAVSPRRPAPAPDRPRHLEVVRGRPTPGRRPPTLFVTVAVVATVTSLLALVLANVLLGQTGFAQVELEQRVAQKRAEVEQLELEVERLGSPSRIADEAERLGLVLGTEATIIDPASGIRGPSPRGGRP